MGPPALTDVPNIWNVDGGLRDIYVLGTVLADWERFMALGASYPCSYEFDGKSASMPDVNYVLQDHDHSHLLSIGVGDVRLHCHFFVVDEIEIDIDPREVKSSVDHDGVLSFMRSLGQTLEKPVIITPENEMETPIVSYDPSNETWRWKADWAPL